MIKNNKKSTNGRKITYAKDEALLQFDYNWIDDNNKLRIGARFKRVTLKELKANPKEYKAGIVKCYYYKKFINETTGRQELNIITDYDRVVKLEDGSKVNLREKYLISKGINPTRESFTMVYNNNTLTEAFMQERKDKNNNKT